MRDDRRVYSDEEFALILRKAAELTQPADPPAHVPGGLTLAEMKAAAAQAGFDPALVERAARLLSTNVSVSSSLLERVIGGQLRHTDEACFPVVLDEEVAAKLLSLLQINVGQQGSGQASAMGLTWHTADDAGGVLSVTARAYQEGTPVTVNLDRRGTLVLTGVLTSFGFILTAVAAIGLGNEVAPAVGAATGLAGVGGVLALARSYWASSTQAARDRIRRAMDTVSQLLTPPGSDIGPGAVGDRTEAAGIQERPSEDAS